VNFPERIPKEDLDMITKEWELLGYSYRIMLAGHLVVLTPVSQSGSRFRLPQMWAEGPSYRDEGDHWKLNFPSHPRVV